MPQNTYYNFGVVNEVLQLTLLFLGRVPLRRVNAILYSIALCFHGQLIEAVLKVADFRGAKGIVRGGDGNSLCPVVLFRAAVVLLQAVENAFPIFSDAGLPNIDNGLIMLLIFAEKEVHTCLLQFLPVPAQVQRRAGNFKGKACPVCQRAFYAAVDAPIHQVQVQAFSSRHSSSLLSVI